MAEPFLGEIRMVGFNFAPKGWAFCNGQLLPISQNTALFSLLGTTYGGNGQTTFALPDLRGRVADPPGAGARPEQLRPGRGHGYRSGHADDAGAPGARALVLLTSKDEQTTNRPDGAYPTVGGIYATTQDGAAPMAPSSSAGGNQPHPNVQPLLVMNFVIAIEGIFPSRN